MIDLEEKGTCRCGRREGKRARGARDFSGYSERARSGVVVKTFYCDECTSDSAQRSLRFTRGLNRR